MRIEKFNKNDLKEIEKFLKEAELPVNDIYSSPVNFFGIKESQKMVAVGALEIYHPYAIVRSVAVSPKLQKNGVGSKMVDFLEEKAKELKIAELFLLTTTAEEFFSKKGYANKLRSSCPEKILNSEEYRNLCPDSAISLSKKLQQKTNYKSTT